MFGMLGGGLPGGDWLATESSGALPLDDIVERSVTGADDVNAVATRNGHETDVLVWNYHDADIPAASAQVNLGIDGLHGAKVTVSELLMDATHSNAYAAWQQMGSPVHPTSEQIEKLQKASALEETIRGLILPIKHGDGYLSLTLPRQGVMLVRLQER
jgi:xylan 1,4-beta-xylosidase